MCLQPGEPSGWGCAGESPLSAGPEEAPRGGGRRAKSSSCFEDTEDGAVWRAGGRIQETDGS